jgi:hypothetical protein
MSAVVVNGVARNAITVMVAAALSGAVVGCTPVATPPPGPVSQAMRALALDLGSLEDALAVPALRDVDQLRALRLLDSIEARANALQHSPAASKHPILGTELPAFRSAVADARLALRRMPPEAAPARELARSCRACHAVAGLTPPSAPSSSPSSLAVASPP